MRKAFRRASFWSNGAKYMTLLCSDGPRWPNLVVYGKIVENTKMSSKE